MGCVYLVRNRINWKGYVGKTNGLLEVRWNQHVWTAFKSKATKQCRALNDAIRKYGVENFEISTLFESDNEQELFEKEEFFIVRLNTHVSYDGYNMTFGGEGVKGYKRSEDVKKRRKIAASVFMLGNKNASGTKVSEERRRKISELHKGNKHGVRYSDSQIKEVREWLALGVSSYHVSKLTGISARYIRQLKQGTRRKY